MSAYFTKNRNATRYRHTKNPKALFLFALPTLVQYLLAYSSLVTFALAPARRFRTIEIQATSPMKYQTRIIRSAATLLLLTSLNALAAPMYYTFEGQVNWGPVDDLNIIAGSSNPFGQGDTVTMVWEVDLVRAGEVTDATTNTTSTQPIHAYARIISGAMLSAADAGISSFNNHKTVFNIGGAAANNANLEDYAFTGSQDHHYFQIRKDSGATVNDYYAGATGFSLYERVLKNGVATRYQVLNQFTLTTISSTNPVPAPGAWLVFTIALTGLLGRAATGK